MWTRQRKERVEEKFKSLKLNIIESIRPPPRSRWRWNNRSHFDFVSFNYFLVFHFFSSSDSWTIGRERWKVWEELPLHFRCRRQQGIGDLYKKISTTTTKRIIAACWITDNSKQQRNEHGARIYFLYTAIWRKSCCCVVYFRVALFLGSKNKLKICRKSISFFRFHRKLLH